MTSILTPTLTPYTHNPGIPGLRKIVYGVDIISSGISGLEYTKIYLFKEIVSMFVHIMLYKYGIHTPKWSHTLQVSMTITSLSIFAEFKTNFGTHKYERDLNLDNILNNVHKIYNIWKIILFYDDFHANIGNPGLMQNKKDCFVQYGSVSKIVIYQHHNFPYHRRYT